METFQFYFVVTLRQVGEENFFKIQGRMCQKHHVKRCQREGEVEREGKNDLKAVKVVENRKKLIIFLKVSH